MPPLDVRYTTAPCRLGIILVASTSHGVCAVSFGDDATDLAASLLRDVPEATPSEDGDPLELTLERIVSLLENPVTTHDVPLDLRGTEFQRAVWNALRDIPAGSTETYSSIAVRIGTPTSARAVGTAVGANRIALLIPCHRAVGAHGRLAGYRWGVQRKRALLQRESEYTGLFSRAED